MIRIPVIHTDTWKRVKYRLQVAPLSFTKRMDLLHESNIPRISGICSFTSSSQTMLEWKSPLQFKRIYPLTTDMCIMCYNRDLRLHHREGILVCSLCGYICDNSTDQDISSYTQSFSVMSSNNRTKQQIPRRHAESCYKRCNHFKETLLRLQGKERVKIQRQEMLIIESEVLKRGLQKEDLSGDVVKLILKHLSMQRYYNNRYYILMKLTGHPLVTLSTEHSKILLKMFLTIQRPYAQHATTRANMISYYYIVKKLCELQGWEDISESLPHLKSKAKILQEDWIWKKICRSIGKPFIPSLL